jgi:hypothetical protein
MEPQGASRVHKSSPLDSVPSQMNPVHILTTYFFNIIPPIYARIS